MANFNYKRYAIIIIFGFICTTSIAQTFFSPDKNFQFYFQLNNAGEAEYSLFYKGKIVLNPSKLGLELKNSPSLLCGFTIKEVVKDSVDETWNPVWGEVSEIQNNYNELLVVLNQEAENRTMKIRFRLFNDGLGFRYEFDKQPNLNYFQVANERTQFVLTANHKAFWIPGNYDSNEYTYNTTLISEIDASKTKDSDIFTDNYFDKNAIQSPLMIKTSDGLYINIFEAALVDYSAMFLKIDKSNFTFTSELVPDALGVKAYMQTPHHTPWRTVIVSDKASDILASKTILNLNEPSKIDDPSFIKPQKFMGIWWGMFIPNGYTWSYSNAPNIRLKDTDWNALSPSGKHGATTANVKRYIDFASENGFDGLLVEGWNVGWEDWIGNTKEEVFDFVTPYPDFNVKELQAYAATKGIKIIMHHETSASVTSYERRIDKAIEFMKDYGYNTVKTGYVGWIIPRGEHHDGQWMVNHYIRVAEKFAENKIMLDAHEPVHPTGLHRTYPNWMACEAARGNEFNAGGKGNPPEHETILPFTRLMGGPMDYTPGIFEIKLSKYNSNSKSQIHTTLAKQLALYVTMYSPLQMAADLPENYAKYMDAFQFIKDVAVDWDDTKYLEAEPGDFITIARKAKGTSNWFVGGITDENSRVAIIPFSFLESNQWYVATVYGDASTADWKENPIAYQIKKVLVNSKSVLKQKLAAGGGVAISIKKASKTDIKLLK